MDQLFWILSIAMSFLYCSLIGYFIYGWWRIPVFTPQLKIPTTFVSVIVPVRNEETNISDLLNCLIKQDSFSDKFEIIVIDDHSEDNTVTVVNDFNKGNIRLIQLGEGKAGKKRAIYEGVCQAQGSLIVTTDADCTMGEQWLSTIVAFYEKYKPKLIVCPVVFKRSNRFFRQMQELEFLSLIGSGAGAIGINHPIMCNGANLAYEKDLVLNNYSILNEETPSGDDVLLLLNVKKKYKKSIYFLKSAEAKVHTKAAGSLKGFFRQRKRWVSKSKLYKDSDIIFTALTVFLINALLLMFLVRSFWTHQGIYPFLILFSSKLLIDYLLLYPVVKFFNRKKLLFYFIPLQVIYFFYVGIISVAGIFGRSQWKGRSI